MKAAQLRIETQEGAEGKKRILPQDLKLFLNDVELTTWRNISFSAGLEEGCVRAKIDLFIDDLRVDADALVVLQDLMPKPKNGQEIKVQFDKLKVPDSNLLVRARR